jgi:hypothetical protein
MFVGCQEVLNKILILVRLKQDTIQLQVFSKRRATLPLLTKAENFSVVWTKF